MKPHPCIQSSIFKYNYKTLLLGSRSSLGLAGCWPRMLLIDKYGVERLARVLAGTLPHKRCNDGHWWWSWVVVVAGGGAPVKRLPLFGALIYLVKVGLLTRLVVLLIVRSYYWLQCIEVFPLQSNQCAFCSCISVSTSSLNNMQLPSPHQLKSQNYVREESAFRQIITAITYL